MPSKQQNPYAPLQLWLADRVYKVGHKYTFPSKNKEIEFSVVSNPSQGSDLLWEVLIHWKGPLSETLLNKIATAKGVEREETAPFRQSGTDKSVYALIRGVQALDDHFMLDFPIPDLGK